MQGVQETVECVGGDVEALFCSPAVLFESAAGEAVGVEIDTDKSHDEIPPCTKVRGHS
jgi:hypothetical protein